MLTNGCVLSLSQIPVLPFLLILTPLSLYQLHKACATSSHLCLQFPAPVSLDPVPVQACIAKLKAAQGGDQDAVIALMELFLCDVRKLSDEDMNTVWEVGLCSPMLRL
jgi:hypothetical protein